MKNENELTNNECEKLLLELAGSKFWQAILKTAHLQDVLTIQSLVAIDPFKDPTSIARVQGRREGVYALKNQVDELIAKDIKKEKEANKKNKNKNKDEEEVTFVQ